MSKPTDIRLVAASLHFLPVRMRVPLKFGAETVTEATCARVRVRVGVCVHVSCRFIIF